MEFPHLLRLIEENQFDTIYHEHFSYFSLLTVRRGLRGARPARCSTSRSCRPTAARCGSTAPRRGRRRARRASARSSWPSASAQPGSSAWRRTRASPRRSQRDKLEILAFLIELRTAGQAHRRLRRAGQGQHAAQLLRHPHRLRRVHRRPEPAQAGPLPARHATSRSGRRRRSASERPDVVLILPWNLSDEIMEQLAYIREWGGRFVARAPEC